MAWYRQYRPQRVQDLHIQSVREQLKRILESGHFSHAYLFAGPKGTGKTSSARILARVLNDPANQTVIAKGTGKLQEPSLELDLLRKIAEGQSQVVIEQDAASHRGIDDVRQLQEHISVVPTEGSVRVVILDEVHMLTNDAFNALLKMLEEPPKNVVFILATTELHKVPATVQSRCQLIRFRQATAEEIVDVLRLIADAEKIQVDAEILERLSVVSGGSFRDAVKYFEQIVVHGKVDPELAQTVLGNDERVTELLRALAMKDAGKIEEFFRLMRSQGVSFRALEQSLLASLQERLSRAIQRKEPAKTLHNIVDLLEHFATRLGGPEPLEGIGLEVACYRWCIGVSSAVHQGESSADAADSPPSPEKSVQKKHPQSKSATIACEKEEDDSSQLNDESVKQSVVVGAVAVNGNQTAISQTDLIAQWSNFLLAVREKSTAVESLLRNAEVGVVEGNTIHFVLKLGFHKERLETPKYSQVVYEVFQERFGLPAIEIIYEVEAPEVVPEALNTNSSEDQLLAAVEEALLSVGI